MSHDPVDMRDGDPVDAATLLASAIAADERARQRHEAAMRDFLLPDTSRLDDRTRAALRGLVHTIVGTIGGDVHGHARRLLRERDEAAALAALDGVAATHIVARIGADLLGEREVADELLDRVALDLIAERLPEALTDSLPASAISDRLLAQRAAALLTAESRRRAPVDQPPYATELTAELHVRFVWTIAGAIAAAAGLHGSAHGAALDRALAEAGQRCLAAHDEGERLEAAAIRYVAALDLASASLPDLIEQALAGRRAVLFVALLAAAAGIAFEDMRALVVDAGDTRLWLALRGIELPRTTIARIGYALCEADPRRDLETFADMLDAIMDVDGDAARAAIAPMKLPRGYRDALATHGNGR